MKAQQHQNLFQVAEIKVSYHPKTKYSERIKITQASDAYKIFKAHWNQDMMCYSESCHMLLLNRASQAIGIYNLSSGALSGTLLDPRMVFSVALKTNASAVILAHNHPSGNPKPSHQDIKITQQILEAGKLLDIAVYDHLILTDEGYLSMVDEGLI